MLREFYSTGGKQLVKYAKFTNKVPKKKGLLELTPPPLSDFPFFLIRKNIDFFLTPPSL